MPRKRYTPSVAGRGQARSGRVEAGTVPVRLVQQPWQYGDMISAWSVADIRAAEAPLLTQGVPLMDRAAFALAAIVARDLVGPAVIADPRGRRDRRVSGSRIALLVGAGNNGGDALFAGANLARRGAQVVAIRVAETVHPEGLKALKSAGGRVLDAYTGDQAEALDTAARAHALLDGIVGIGSGGALRGPGRTLVEALNGRFAESGRRPWIVAVDVPSGIGVDDGTVAGPVLAADRTVTFGAAKPGLVLPPAAPLAGRCTVVDLGFDMSGHPAVRRLEADDVARLWAVPTARDHKYTRGVLGVIAGTLAYPGAAVLVTTAAVRTGAGMVRYRGPDAVAKLVLDARPEVVPTNGRVQAWVLGSGIPPVPEDGEAVSHDVGVQHDRVRYALAAASGELAEGVVERVPTVVDAGALSLLPPRVPASVVLTPHAGELAALLVTRGVDVVREDIEAEPVRWAVRTHELTGATVVLKGAVTVVVGEGSVFAQPDGPSWLATAGSGDVLAGILGTVLAAHGDQVKKSPRFAAELAAAAVAVHGLAAAHANPGGPVAALEVADHVSDAVAELLGE